MAEQFGDASLRIPGPMNQRILLPALVYYSGLDTFTGFRLPGLAETYGSAYRVGLNAIASGLNLDRYLRVVEAKAPDGLFDSSIEVRSYGFAQWVGHRHSSRYLTYMASIFLIALVVAAPLEWKRRLRLLLPGLLILHAYLAVRLGLALLLLDPTHPDELLPGVPLSRESGAVLWEIALMPWYVAPLLVWALLVGRAVATPAPNLDA